MFTNNKTSYNGNDKVLIEAACLSTDTKPTTGIANGSACIEMDTGKTFMFNEEGSEWEELPDSGGGGGGGSSDFSTAQVTIINASAVGQVSIPIVMINAEYGFEGSYASSRGAESPYTIILYKGKAYLPLISVASTSGNISVDEETGLYVVTGDCTITFESPE